MPQTPWHLLTSSTTSFLLYAPNPVLASASDPRGGIPVRQKTLSRNSVPLGRKEELKRKTGK
jgi:hypothetical protein